MEHVDPEDESVQAVILAPTRELAIQIRDDLRELAARKKGIQVVCLYGGQPIDKQISQLKKIRRLWWPPPAGSWTTRSAAPSG